MILDCTITDAGTGQVHVMEWCTTLNAETAARREAREAEAARREAEVAAESTAQVESAAPTPTTAPVVGTTVPSPAPIDSGVAGDLLSTALLIVAVGLVLALRGVPRVAASPVGPWLAAAARGAGHVGALCAMAQRGSRRRLVLALVAVFVGVLLLCAFVPLALRPVALLALLVAVGGGPRKAPAPEQWWSHGRLVGALTAAGVLARPRQGEAPVMLRYWGAVQHGERGTSCAVALPAGVPASAVRAKREQLAAAMGVPTARLEVSQQPDDPANVVRIWVGTGAVAPSGEPDVARATATRWTDPLRLGVDTQGRPVHMQTTGVHSLFSGASGSGKSTAARLLVGHALLDASTTVYIIDGKADAADWSDAAPSCAGFVGHIDDDTPARVAAIFDDVLGIVRARAAASAGRGRAAWPGVLVVVEEWAAVRSHAATVLDPKAAEALDRSMATLLATARSSGVHIALLAQRATADNLPTSQRANVAQRVVLRCLSPEDYAAALGGSPVGATPTRKGQALVVNEDVHQALATVDHLDDGAWLALCARAAAMRPDRATPAPEAAPDPVAEVPDPEVVDPLLEAVLDVLADGDPAGMPASEILERLPPWLAPGSAVALGKRLRGFDALELGRRGKSPAWRLRRPLADPSATPRPEGSEGGSAPPRRSDGPAVAHPSQPSHHHLKET